MFGLFGECMITLIQIWPYIRYNILSNNESRFDSSVMTEYFIDREKYFYLIILHAVVASYIGAFAMVATGTMLIAYLQHTCAMFSIAR